MKLWQLAIVCSAVVAFLWLAEYAYHQSHPDIEHGYSKSDQEKLGVLLDAPKPVRLTRGQMLLADLFADDGQPVDRKIKAREWHRARKTLGKE